MTSTIRHGLLCAAALAIGACAGEPDVPEDASLAGTQWLAEDIQQRGVLDRVETTLGFPSDDVVSGDGGCNRYFGPVSLDGNRISVGDLGSTMMACAEPVMDQERRFLQALGLARTWRIDPDSGQLHLANEAGDEILRFSRRD